MPVFIKSWYEKGIKVVQDFFYEDCKLWVFGVFKNIYNPTDSCFSLVWFEHNTASCEMQCNSIVTATCISKYIKLLTIDRSSVKRLPNLYGPLILNL